MIEELFEYCHNREKIFMYGLESEKVFSLLFFSFDTTQNAYIIHTIHLILKFVIERCRKLQLPEDEAWILHDRMQRVRISLIILANFDRPKYKCYQQKLRCYSVSRKVDAPKIYGRTLFAKIVSFSGR